MERRTTMMMTDSMPIDALNDLQAANGSRGEAVAFIHVAGYTLKLGFDKIKWLLEESRWKQCGFDTLEAFADSIQFDTSVKAASETRKELVVLFKKADEAKPISNRKITKALNVDDRTIGRDAAANAAPAEKTASENNDRKNASAVNAAPALRSGERAARLVTNKAESQEAKREKRDARERETASRILALPQKKYGVIYSDPEWDFEVWSRETGMDRAAANHYQTSPLDAIKARDIPSIAADDCVLFLWATVPILPQALEVMAAWGFAYKTHIVWSKDRIGSGFWLRNEHELLLIGTRGNVPAPAPGTQWSSVVRAPVGAHSAKPAIFYELIESYFPHLPKIELNARTRRPGWDAWDFEAPRDGGMRNAGGAPLTEPSDACGEARVSATGEPRDSSLRDPCGARLSRCPAERLIGRPSATKPKRQGTRASEPQASVKREARRAFVSATQSRRRTAASRQCELPPAGG
jgi:N6-adenosine-specific RNA methylase IME4